MSYLLDLPREVRERIIEVALFSERTIPSDLRVSAAEQQRQGTRSANGVVFEESSVTPNCIPLLLVNKQISWETSSAIKRLTEHLSCSLEVLIVGERELWPIWLCVPAFTKLFKSVNVTFHSVNGVGQGRSAFEGGTGGPLPIVWSFYSLLVLFLKRGPQIQEASEDKHISIKTLILNFVYDGDDRLLSPEHLDLFELRRERYGSNALKEAIIRPGLISGLISDMIAYLLAMNRYTSEYGAILYERIGAIQILLNGTLEKEFELGEMLAKLSHNQPQDTFGNVHPPEDRVPRFWEWKGSTLKKREELGLPVAPQTDRTSG